MKKVALVAALVFFTASFAFADYQNCDFYMGVSKPTVYVPPDNHTFYAPSAAIMCLPCAIDENEPIILDGGEDTVNGGCNSNPPVFTPINVGDVFCGLTNTYDAANRDTDWYKIVLTETKDLYWTILAECEVNIIIASDDGSCGNVTPVASYGYFPANTIGQTHFVCTPGTWYFWVGSTWYDGLPEGAQYQVVLSEGAPSDPWCGGPIPTLNEWGIIISGSLLSLAALIVFRRKEEM